MNDLNRVSEVLTETLNEVLEDEAEGLDWEAPINTQVVDSIDRVRVFMIVAEALGIDNVVDPDEFVDNVETLGDVVRYLTKYEV
jgi:acyl carrier protein